MARQSLKSTSTPIIMGAVSIPLSVALLVGWTLLIGRRLASADDATLDTWLLIAGAVSFLVIVLVIGLLSFYLVREILEVRRQDGFINSVTHELKSPLASIKLCLETLARRELPKDKEEELRSMMLQDVDRLSSFIDDVLQASRLANLEEVGLTISEFELRPLVNNIGQLALSHGKSKQAELVIDIPDAFGLSTDQAAVSIIMRNLIDNAYKYGGDSPRIVVSAWRDARGRARVSVSDEGVGIDPKQIKRIFQRFFRATGPAIRRHRGTGLGLFVVSALVRNMGGKVSAHSAGLDQGTEIRIVLPPDNTHVSSNTHPEGLSS